MQTHASLIQQFRVVHGIVRSYVPGTRTPLSKLRRRLLKRIRRRQRRLRSGSRRDG